MILLLFEILLSKLFLYPDGSKSINYPFRSFIDLQKKQYISGNTSRFTFLPCMTKMNPTEMPVDIFGLPVFVG